MEVFDVVFLGNPEGFRVEVPDFRISFDCKGSRREAIQLAAEKLKAAIEAQLVMGEELPEPTNVMWSQEPAEVITLAVQVDLPRVGLITVEQAMEILGVSQPRIAHLLRDGRIKAIQNGRRKLITRESVEMYLATPRTPGRPKKGISYMYMDLKHEKEAKDG